MINHYKNYATKDLCPSMLKDHPIGISKEAAVGWSLLAHGGRGRYWRGFAMARPLGLEIFFRRVLYMSKLCLSLAR